MSPTEFYSIPTRITIRRNNLPKSRPRFHARKVTPISLISSSAPQYIPIQVTQRKYCKNTNLRQHRNPNNLVKVPLKSFAKSEGSKSAYVPTFLLSNVMSLVPKIDEVREVVQQENYDLVCLVETWLQDHIHDNVVHVPGYNLIRRDRSERIHGGVCIM